jgi:hypothetical protein
VGAALRGVIAEFVPKRTLSSVEERGAGISQRPKPILERFRRPNVVAIKADVFPAERSDVGEQHVGQNFALGAKLGDSVAEIDGVPEGDGGDREVETRGPVALIFEGTVADLAVVLVPESHGGLLEELSGTGGRDDAKTKSQAGKSRRQRLKFFVVSVTIRYIMQSKKQQKNVFTKS